MTEAEKVAYELSEDKGTVGTHKLHTRPCTVCRKHIQHKESDVRVYRRPKRIKSEKDKRGADMVQIKPKLISYFRKHPGIDVYADDIVQALNETRERVLGGMTNILNPNQSNSVAVQEFAKHTEKRGTGVWRYRPPNTSQESGNNRSSKRLFTEVGAKMDGTLVLQCEDGKLFEANEV